ncbi:MAG: FtsH protease activity modulator HflK [Gammaproteobacteria bacterium]|nr:FtsH protease activity modulator HflK [Gammaproteobacteria bacterium]MBU1653637.1 FtsH protease activity modulator HflK [Gammaproteobacteria bacterium]MBU1962749.1 FtsH protease activity modulator HflK [Gammaproteobacteria bacterium]
MAWNEPGNDKDPWGGRQGNEGPPDLDEVVKNLQRKLSGLFGSRSGGEGSGPGGPVLGGVGIGLVLVLILAIWLASGIYIIEPAERGLVLHFGAFKKVTQPGPNWHIPFPVEQVIKVNVDQISTFRHKAQMLTRDENIVDVELTVQSRIQDAVDYEFQDQNPDKTIQDATETAVRETIGKNKLDFILTEGRSAIAEQIREGIQALLDLYKTGMVVTSVNMQPAKPPEAVKSAFDDAIKAREDKERQENEAQAYANEVVPKARGASARRIADAEAYRDRRIAESEGEANRFDAVLTEYEKAPDVTRQRLYLETVEVVLGKTGKVIMDVEGGNNLTYLPLDRIIGNAGSAQAESAAADAAATQQSPSDASANNRVERPLREDARVRRVR